MATYQLDILTPDGHVFTGPVESVVAPGQEGSFGVLAHHASMIVALKPGVMTTRNEEQEHFYAVGEGILETKAEGVQVLVDAALEAKSLEAALGRIKELTSPWDV